MKPTTTIILLVFLALCIGAAAIVYTGALKPKKDDRASREPEDLFDPSPAKVKRLTIAPADGQAITFERVKKDEWRIVKPVHAKAQSYKVTDVTGKLEKLKGTEVKDAKDKLTGLASPRWTLTFVDDKNVERTVHVGKAHPMIRGELYVRVGDEEKAYAVKADIEDELARPLSEYRDKSILSITSDDVVGVEIAGEKSFQLKKADDAWTLTTDRISAKADKDKVKDLIGNFTYLYADKFVSDDPAKHATYGLAKDEQRLTLRVTMKPEKPKDEKTPPTTQPAKPGKTYVVLLGRRLPLTDDKIFARFEGENSVFTLKSSLLKDLQPELSDLRDKAIVTLDSDKVTRVRLALATCQADLKKDDEGKWRMLKPYEGPANEDAVKQLLTDAKGLKADRFIDAGPASIDMGPDVGRVTFSLEGGLTAELLIGKAGKTPEETYVKLAEGKSLAVVPTDSVKKLQAGPAAYWNPTLREKIPAHVAVSLKIQRPGEAGAMTFARDQTDRWVMTVPVQADPDRTKVKDIVTALADLKAEKIVSVGPTVPEKYAKAKEHITVRLVTEEPKPPAPVTQPASRPATQPATQPTTQPASQPATQPAKKPAPKKAAGATPGPKPSDKPPAPAAKKPAAKAPTTRPADKGPAKTPATKPAPAKKTPATKPAPKAPTTKPAPKRPAKETSVIHVVKVDGKVYAWVEGRKIAAVGECKDSLWDDLTAELRDRQLMDVIAADVRTAKLSDGKTPLEFRKEKDTWKDAANPFVAIDSDKVKTLVEDTAGLKAEKFVSHKTDAAAAKKFGLDKPARTVEIKTDKGKPIRLSVSATGPKDSKDRYATVTGVEGVFVLSEDSVKKITKERKDFKKE